MFKLVDLVFHHSQLRDQIKLNSNDTGIDGWCVTNSSQVYFGVASHLSLTVVGRVYHSQLDVNFRSHSVNPKDEPMVGPGVWNSFCCIWESNNNVNAMTNTFKNLCKQTTFGRNCIYFQDWLLELFSQPTGIRSNGRRHGPTEPITLFV